MKMKTGKWILAGWMIAASLFCLSGCGNGQEKEAVAADEASVAEEPAEQELQEEPETALPVQAAEHEEEIRAARVRHEYADVLSQLVLTWQLPDMEVEGTPEGATYEIMEENQFAIADLDGDGREELMIAYTTASMAGMFMVVYDYDPDTEELKKEWVGFPGDVAFYDNGIIAEAASHNHSYGEFWPTSFWKYDSAADEYIHSAYVGTWDRTFTDTYGEEPFPEKLDTDGDGILYAIQECSAEDLKWEASVYQQNRADYEAWYDSQLGGAKEITLDCLPIVYENYVVYTRDYLALLEAVKEETDPETGVDIGCLFLKEDRYVMDVAQILVEDYGIVLETEEGAEDYHTGFYQGEEIFEFGELNAGDIAYKNKQVEDVTLFGIYPGMEEELAWEKAKVFGFYEYNDDGSDDGWHYFITGTGMGNRSLWFHVEEGKVAEVGAAPFCLYVG